MEVRSFVYDRFAVVVSAKTAQGLIRVCNSVRQSGRNGEIISFQDGQIMIDFGRRCVIEGPDAVFEYWLQEGDRTIFEVAGIGENRRRSVEMVPGSNGMYKF